MVTSHPKSTRTKWTTDLEFCTYTNSQNKDQVITAMDGQPPSTGWSPTIQKKVTQLPKEGHPPSAVWSHTIPRIVIHHHWDGNQSFLGWLPTIPKMLTNHWKLTLRLNLPMDVHQSSKIWSSTFPRIVTQLQKDGHPQSQVWRPTIQNLWNLIKPYEALTELRVWH